MSNKVRGRKRHRQADVKHARQMPKRDNAERLENGDWRVELPARHGISQEAEGLGTTEGPVATLNGKPHIVVEVADEYTLILRPWPVSESLRHRAKVVTGHLKAAVGAALARPGR